MGGCRRKKLIAALLYDLTWGKDAAFFDLLKARGKKLGESAQEGRPEIPQRLFIYWSAFIALHRRRQFAHMGPQPLSFSDIQSYITLCFNHQGSLNYRSRFIRFITAMDDAYLTDVVERQKS